MFSLLLHICIQQPYNLVTCNIIALYTLSNLLVLDGKHYLVFKHALKFFWHND